MRVKVLLAVLISAVSFPFADTARTPQAPQATQAGTQAQALALAQQAQAALFGSGTVSDITLTGTATRTIGADSETGNFTLKALGDDQSRFDIVLSAGTSSEIYNVSATSNSPQGLWIDSSGAVQPIANHNCLAGEIWFFPALSIVGDLANPATLVSYVGPETKNGASVQHLTYSMAIPRTVSGPDPLIAQLSRTDVYLDSSTLLPVAITYSVHPDNNYLVNIPVKIDFSSYQAVQGVQTPFHVQRYFNGTLLYDLTVQSATVNSGLTSAAFSVN
jgi:hypothetical protein